MRVTQPREFNSRRAAWLAVGVFAVLSLYCAFRSEGFIAADACIHYLYARFAPHEPTRWVDVWARPLVTGLYALPAVLGGRIAVRVVCCIVAIGCAYVAMAISRGQGCRLPVLALIFTLGQPVLFLHSFGEMTELPFALLLGLAFLAYQKERLGLATILVSLTPLARPEGFGFLLLVAITILSHRKWGWIALLPLPLIAWDLIGWWISGKAGPWWRWLPGAWPYSSQSLYGSGNLLTLLVQLPAIVSPLVVPAMLVGLIESWKIDPAESAHGARCRRLTAFVPLFVLGVHSILYWTGRMASFGEVRYLLVAAPLWGVLSARGWETVFTNMRWPHPVRWAGAAVMVAPMVANLVYPTVPVGLSADWNTARSMARWCEQESVRRAYPRFMAAHPGVFYFLDVSPCDRNRVTPWDQPTAARMPAGTLLIWDPIYASQNASASHAVTLEQVRQAGWRELNTEPALQMPASWHVFVSR